ncbi:hypothetical protein [Halomonas sp. WWR20]
MADASAEPALYFGIAGQGDVQVRWALQASMHGIGGITQPSDMARARTPYRYRSYGGE